MTCRSGGELMGRAARKVAFCSAKVVLADATFAEQKATIRIHNLGVKTERPEISDSFYRNVSLTYRDIPIYLSSHRRH